MVSHSCPTIDVQKLTACLPPAQHEAEKEEDSGEEGGTSEDDEEIEIIPQPPGEAGSDYCLQEVMRLQDTVVARMEYNAIRVFLIFTVFVTLCPR